MTLSERQGDPWFRDPSLLQGTGWGWILAYGVMLAVIGVLALVEPLATGFATGIFLAFVLVVGGILGIVAGFSARGWRSSWLDFAVGLISLVLGLLILWDPFAGALSLVWAIGLWLVLCAIMEFAAAARTALHRGWLIVLGIIDLVMGLALMFAGPAAALVFLAMVVGISFLLRGLFLAIFALRLRRRLETGRV